MQTANLTELARLTGFNRATVRELLNRHGVSPVESNAKTGAKEYALEHVLSAIFADRHERSEPTSSKQRKELADAERAEIRVAKLRDQFIAVDVVRTSAADLMGSLRERCLAETNALAEKITGQTERQEIEIAIREHYAAIFEELRSNPSVFLPSLAQDSEQTKNDK